MSEELVLLVEEAKVAEKTNDYKVISARYAAALETARKEKDAKILLFLLNRIAGISTVFGYPEEVRRHVDEIRSHISDPKTVASTETTYAMIGLGFKKDLNAAEKAYDNATRALKEVPLSDPDYAVMDTALRQVAQGMHVARSTGCFRSFYDELRSVPRRVFTYEAVLDHQIGVLLDSGEVEKMELGAKLGLRHAKEISNPDFECSMLTVLANCQAVKGDREKSLEILEEAARVPASKSKLAGVHLQAVFTSLKMEDLDKAERAMEKAHGFMDRMNPRDPEEAYYFKVLNNAEAQLNLARSGVFPDQEKVTPMVEPGREDVTPLCALNAGQLAEMAKRNNSRLNTCQLYEMLLKDRNPALDKERRYYAEEARGLFESAFNDIVLVMGHIGVKKSDLRSMSPEELSYAFIVYEKPEDAKSETAFADAMVTNSRVIELLCKDIAKSNKFDIPERNKGEILWTIDTMDVQQDIKKQLRETAAKQFGMKLGNGKEKVK